MLKRIFKAENVKLQRSFLLYLHLAVLILFPVLLGFYYGNSQLALAGPNLVANFYEFLAVASPIMISIVICLVFDREEKAGNFKNWLSSPVSKAQIIEGQLLYYWLWYAIEIIGSSLIYYAILVGIYHITGISFLKFLTTSIIFALLGLVQYEVTQMIALKWGIGGSLVLGFFGTILSLLANTVLLDFVWPIIPWAWQFRLVTFWLPNINQTIVTLSGIEYVCPLIMTVIVAFLARKYFNKWQGK